VLLDLAWTRPRSSTLPAAVANGRLLVAVPASSLESRRGGAEQKWVAAAVGEEERVVNGRLAAVKWTGLGWSGDREGGRAKRGNKSPRRPARDAQ
jgi:hypothetical protein